MENGRRASHNSPYKKLAVQWLNDTDSYGERWQKA